MLRTTPQGAGPTPREGRTVVTPQGHRLYVAAPIAVLRRPGWRSQLTAIRRRTKSPLWDPGSLFGSTTSWLIGWPRIVEKTSGLVLVTDLDQSIGAGCLREIAEVLGRDLPVWLWSEGDLVPWSETEVVPAVNPSRFRVAAVRRAATSSGK